MKTTKKLSQLLSQYLGMDVEVVDLDDPDADASPEAKEFAEQMLKEQEKRNAEMSARRSQVSQLVDHLLSELAHPCCEKSEHRRKPKDGDDVLAVNNAMQAMITHHGEVAMEYVGRQRGIIDDLLKKLGRGMNPRNEEELKSLDLEMAAVHSILASHFELVARAGRIDYLNHYAKISAMIKAWSENKETGKNEAGTTH